MNITEKCAYLKGLAEGMNLDAASSEVKLINGIIDLLGDVTEAIDEIDCDLETLGDYVEELDEDLGAVEELLYDDCDCDCCCDDDDFCDDDDDLYCVECENCHEINSFDDSADPETLKCENCGAPLCVEE